MPNLSAFLVKHRIIEFFSPKAMIFFTEVFNQIIERRKSKTEVRIYFYFFWFEIFFINKKRKVLFEKKFKLY